MSEDPRHAYLSRYVTQLADFIGLRHWVIRVSEDMCDEGSWCEINIDEYDEALISVGSKFWNASPQVKTQALLHELFHCPVARINSDMALAMESLLAFVEAPLKPVAQEQLNIHLKAAGRREEQLVNFLGVLLAPLAPQWKSKY